MAVTWGLFTDDYFMDFTFRPFLQSQNYSDSFAALKNKHQFENDGGTGGTERDQTNHTSTTGNNNNDINISLETKPNKWQNKTAKASITHHDL